MSSGSRVCALNHYLTPPLSEHVLNEEGMNGTNMQTGELVRVVNNQASSSEGLCSSILLSLLSSVKMSSPSLVNKTSFMGIRRVSCVVEYCAVIISKFLLIFIFELVFDKQNLIGQ